MFFRNFPQISKYSWNLIIFVIFEGFLPFFLSIVIMFQSKSAPVHCCPTSCKWTPEPTLNKKSQDCSVIEYPVKARLPDIFETAGFSAKVYLCALSQHCSSNFLVQCYLRHICGQHWLDNVPRQCCSSMVDTTLYRLCSSYKLYLSHGPTFHRQFPYAMLAHYCRLLFGANMFVDCGPALHG